MGETSNLFTMCPRPQQFCSLFCYTGLDRPTFASNVKDMEKELTRFLVAQERDYLTALAEIRQGKKRSHWMWYIFPQIEGLGHSSTAQFYAIRDLQEAAAYLAHKGLGSRLVEISKALLSLPASDPTEIFGSPDDLKLRSCMTLFSEVPGTNPVFFQVLDKYFGGQKDDKTVSIVKGG